MHVVSVYLHYNKTIWLPWQRPWQIGEWGIDPSSACKALSYGEKIAKIGPVHPEILDDIRRSTTWTRNAISIRMFSAETTGPIFTKVLHDIVALVASSSKTKDIGKRRSDWSSSLQYLPYGAKIVKIGPADPEILRFRANESGMKQKWLSWQRTLRYRKKNFRSIIYTVSQKTTMTFYAITSMHINRFW